MCEWNMVELDTPIWNEVSIDLCGYDVEKVDTYPGNLVQVGTCIL